MGDSAPINRFIVQQGNPQWQVGNPFQTRSPYAEANLLPMNAYIQAQTNIMPDFLGSQACFPGTTFPRYANSPQLNGQMNCALNVMNSFAEMFQSFSSNIDVLRLILENTPLPNPQLPITPNPGTDEPLPTEPENPAEPETPTVPNDPEASAETESEKQTRLEEEAKASEHQKKVGSEVNYLKNLEGHREGLDEEQLKARAEFNLSKKDGKPNLDLLGKYLFHRQLIKDPAERAKVDKLTFEIADKLDIKYTDKPYEELDREHQGNLKGADYAAKVIIASQLATVLRNRPELIDQINTDEDHNNALVRGLKILGANRRDPLRVRILEKGFPEDTGGELRSNMVFLDKSGLADGSPHDNYNVVIHEFMHALDASGEAGDDGILFHMTDSQQGKFKKAYQKLYDEYKATGKPPSGFSEYAFKNNRDYDQIYDFLADTVPLFISDPKSLKNASGDLYDVYRYYFKIDPMNEHVLEEPKSEPDKKAA